MPWLELVPNVSEGRDDAVVRRVVDAFAGAGAHVLDVDGSRAAHRTVVTLAGEAEVLVEAAVAGARAAVEAIDLRVHRGVHPRMGALDVCPFVPLAGATTEDAVAAAREAALRIGSLGLPVYLYGEAATRPERRLLHQVREGQFEGLAARMPSHPPDAGPDEPHPSAGAVAVGARFYLVAFNVNLGTDDVRVARRVAREVREWRRVVRDAHGAVVEAEPGRLREVRAIGWYVEDFGCAQVSTNLVDYRVTPPHVLLDAVREEAARHGVEVTGTELVGCIPEEALSLAGPDPVRRLLLDAAKPFDPDRKVLERSLARIRSSEENRC